MAVIIEGKTRCPICKRPHSALEELYCFPAFTFESCDSNELLLELSDSAVHLSCLRERQDILNELLRAKVITELP